MVQKFHVLRMCSAGQSPKGTNGTGRKPALWDGDRKERDRPVVSNQRPARRALPKRSGWRLNSQQNSQNLAAGEVAAARRFAIAQDLVNATRPRRRVRLVTCAGIGRPPSSSSSL